MIMMKFNLLAMVAAAIMTVGSVSAGGQACCGHDGRVEAKAACDGNFADLKLNDDQQSKLGALAAKCKKDGCTEASQAEFLKGAEPILSAEQFAQLKAECSKHQGEKS
jgi:hypothetical protein